MTDVAGVAAADVEVRVAGPWDAAAIAEIYGPVVRDSAISFELAPPSRAEMVRRVSKTLAVAPWLVAVVEGRTIGYAYGQRHRSREAYQWSVETSVFVDVDWRVRGVGRRLYGVLLHLLGLQGFCRCFAGITLPNVESVRLHESLGFRSVGVFRSVGYKLNAWHDVGWWQADLAGSVAPPAPPVLLSQLGTDALLHGAAVDVLADRIRVASLRRPAEGLPG